VIISAKLNQKDIVRIRQNQEVNIKIDAFPDVTFTGTLSEISSSPDENAN
jgi:multidrug resistance efflux pump